MPNPYLSQLHFLNSVFYKICDGLELSFLTTLEFVNAEVYLFLKELYHKTMDGFFLLQFTDLYYHLRKFFLMLNQFNLILVLSCSTTILTNDCQTNSLMQNVAGKLEFPKPLG